MTMAESSPARLKRLWKKEKLLVTSNFSFSLSVFKRDVLKTRKNQGLFGKGLKVMSNVNRISNNPNMDISKLARALCKITTVTQHMRPIRLIVTVRFGHHRKSPSQSERSRKQK